MQSCLPASCLRSSVWGIRSSEYENHLLSDLGQWVLTWDTPMHDDRAYHDSDVKDHTEGF